MGKSSDRVKARKVVEENNKGKEDEDDEVEEKGWR